MLNTSGGIRAFAVIFFSKMEGEIGGKIAKLHEGLVI
jgi:hypothetical protein